MAGWDLSDARRALYSLGASHSRKDPTLGALDDNTTPMYSNNAFGFANVWVTSLKAEFKLSYYPK